LRIELHRDGRFSDSFISMSAASASDRPPKFLHRPDGPSGRYLR